MTRQGKRENPSERWNKQLRDTGRAFGGAIVFALPMLMTMEFWELGFVIDPIRLLIFVLVAVPVLTELSRRIGFESSQRLGTNLIDAFFALLIGAVTAVVVLTVFDALTLEMSTRETVGKVAIQTVPAAIGALLARAQFGEQSEDEVGEESETYGGEMLLMAIGALFLGFNIAPTEEVVLIAYRITPWHALGLVAVSLMIMHGFVFAVSFRGGTTLDPETPWWSAFLRLTLPGYMIALAVSLYVLWTFHRIDDVPVSLALFTVIVLGLPSSVGAAAARLIL
jgi:putative integral membrane protein TIGR02587